jgi:HEAT repeat protein
MDFSQTVEHLLESDTSFEPSILYSLSKPEPEEIEHLTSVWLAIPVERRRALVKELVEITETNFEVDFDLIFRHGLRDGDSQVRATSVEGLWENEELALMTELLHLLQNDPSVRVRAAVALSLGRFILMGELGKLPAEHCRTAYEALCNLILEGSDDLEVCRRAIESVAYVSTKEVAALLQEAYDHPEEKMRISAVFGMGRAADARWIDTVAGELSSTNHEMRYEAARACGELEARAAVDRLAELIDDPDREVREATLWALGQIGGDEARRLLQICCEKENAATRGAAEAALQELEFMYGQLEFPFYAFDSE